MLHARTSDQFFHDFVAPPKKPFRLSLEKREVLLFDMVVMIPAGIVALSVFGSLLYDMILGADTLSCLLTMGVGFFTILFGFSLLIALNRFKTRVDDLQSLPQDWVLDKW